MYKKRKVGAKKGLKMRILLYKNYFLKDVSISFCIRKTKKKKTKNKK
jgi:hypothetical protein